MRRLTRRIILGMLCAGMKKVAETLAYALSVTAITLVLSWRWGISPVKDWPIEGLGGPSRQADEIRGHFPHTLIKPEWIVGDTLTGGPHDLLLIKWMVAECRARLACLVAAWLVLNGLVVKLIWSHNGQVQPASCLSG
jgi:hypothetical protein